MVMRMTSWMRLLWPYNSLANKLSLSFFLSLSLTMTAIEMMTTSTMYLNQLIFSALEKMHSPPAID